MRSLLTLLCVASAIGFHNGAIAQLRFSDMMHDFGNITDGAIVKYKFHYTNVGQRPLKLGRVEASCGCTTPAYTREDIAPGQSGDIEVAFNSTGRPGDFSKGISVYYDENPQPVILTVKGKVLPATPMSTTTIVYPDTMGGIAFDTQRAVANKPLKSSENQEFVFRFRNVSRQTITFSSPDAAPFLAVSFSAVRIASGQEGTITVKWLGAKAVENNLTESQSLNLPITLHSDDPKNPDKVLYILGSYERTFTEAELANAPRISFDKKEFDGGDLISGEKLVYQFWFTNQGRSPLRIESVGASCGCTATAPQDSIVQAGQRSYITATFDSRGRMGNQGKTITVRSNDPATPSIVLSLRCNVVADPFSGGSGAPVPSSGGMMGTPSRGPSRNH